MKAVDSKKYSKKLIVEHCIESNQSELRGIEMRSKVPSHTKAF